MFLYHDLDGYTFFKFLTVRDDAYASVALTCYLLQFLKRLHDGIEIVLIQGSEALVDEEDVDVHIRTVERRQGEGQGEGYHESLSAGEYGRAA